MFGQKTKKKDDIFHKLHHRPIRCMSVKDLTTYRETVIGRDGIINVSDGEMIIIFQNTEAFRKEISYLEVAELLSRDGFTITDQLEENIMYVVYYKK